MRQIRKSPEGIKEGKLDLSPFGLQGIADFLDTQKALHIEEIYFTNDGKYWLTCYEWQGQYYSRLDFEPVEYSSGGAKIWKRIRVGKPENLIVKVLEAQEIVDKVLIWREKYAKQTVIIDTDDVRNFSIDLPEHQKTKKIVWVEDPEKVQAGDPDMLKLKGKTLSKISKKEIINGKNKN